MLRYAITSVSHHATAAERKLNLLADAARWMKEGVEFVQLREKTLRVEEVFDMACAVKALFDRGSTTKLLINGRADIAVAAGADGVHLTSGRNELTAVQVREIFGVAGRAQPLIAISCHALDEVFRAKAVAADLLVFGPVFEKRVGNVFMHSGAELTALHEAVKTASPIAVFALGGVDHCNASQCLAAGAAGVAGIRFFSDPLQRKT